MSFRLFLYYCALVGGWAAFLGWFVGLFAAPESNPIFSDAIKGLFLGFCVGLGLGCVDAIWNISTSQIGLLSKRLGVALLVGAFGGFLGGFVGRSLFGFLQDGILEIVFFVLGWTLTGALIGAAVGVSDFIEGVFRGDDLTGPKAKLRRTLLGGTVGGILGGSLAYLLKQLLPGFLSEKAATELLSPTAIGFVALGMCIGLLIGLTQVILKEAWVKVEVGFRAGREKILTKEQTTIGRAESCDIGLFSDQKVQKLHAKIVQVKDQYFVQDENTPNGTFVNNQQVPGRAPIKSGDRIRVGDSILCFLERQKR
ncbi:MAG: FHA domain-containing protein [Gemmataceae bacterium]